MYGTGKGDSAWGEDGFGNKDEEVSEKKSSFFTFFLAE